MQVTSLQSFRFDDEQLRMLETALDFALGLIDRTGEDIPTDQIDQHGLVFDRGERQIVARLSARFEGAREEMTGFR